MTRRLPWVNVLVVSAVLMLGGCRDAAQVEALNTQIRSLEAAQKQAKTDLSRVQLQLRTLEKETEAIREEKIKLEGRLKEAQESLDALLKEFSDYKAQYKVSVRRKAQGMRLADLSLNQRDYHNVRIRELSDTMVTILHESGTASFQLEELPEKLQRLLGYESGSPMVLKNGGPSAGVEKSLEDELDEVREQIKRVEVERHLLYQKRSASQIELARSRDDAERRLVHERACAAVDVQMTQLDVEVAQLKSRELALEGSIKARR